MVAKSVKYYFFLPKYILKIKKLPRLWSRRRAGRQRPWNFQRLLEAWRAGRTKKMFEFSQEKSGNFRNKILWQPWYIHGIPCYQCTFFVPSATCSYHCNFSLFDGFKFDLSVLPSRAPFIPHRFCLTLLWEQALIDTFGYAGHTVVFVNLPWNFAWIADTAKFAIPKRPGVGKDGRTIPVAVNFLPLTVRATGKPIVHYDVQFEPDKPKFMYR